MRTPASIGKHPIHPMLVIFPLGLWIFFLVWDRIGLTVAMPDVWCIVAFYSMVGGLIDLLYCEGGAPLVKKIARANMVINLSIVVLYVVNIWLCIRDEVSMNVPTILPVIGVCAIAVSAWLGAQTVHLYRTLLHSSMVRRRQARRCFHASHPRGRRAAA